jgi:hypothetical protein
MLYRPCIWVTLRWEQWQQTVFQKDNSGAMLSFEVDARHVCELTSTRNMQVAVLTQWFLLDK